MIRKKNISDETVFSSTLSSEISTDYYIYNILVNINVFNSIFLSSAVIKSDPVNSLVSCQSIEAKLD